MQKIEYLIYMIIFVIIKGLISYNEELLLFIIYINLFVFIIYNIEQINKKFLIDNMIKVMDKYDISFYIKVMVVQKIYKFLKIYKDRIFLEYTLNFLNLEIKNKISVYLKISRNFIKLLLLSWVIMLKVEN